MIRLAGGIIEDAQGRILLLHRNSSSGRQQWEIPGGQIIEDGEIPQGAAQREIREKLGIEVSIIACVGEQSFVEDGQSMHYTWFSARIEAGAPEVREPRKFDALGYFHLTDLRIRDDLSSNLRNFLDLRVAEYDAIARTYAAINYNRPLMKFAVYHSFFGLLGDLREKSVLDLACGEGTITEKIVSLGADKVDGVDRSSEMVRIAMSREEKSHKTSYRVGCVGALGKIGSYDVVTGSFLLHYAKTAEELEAMCRDISANLKEGGRFVGIINNPEHPLGLSECYKNTVKCRALFPNEGDKLYVSIWDGEKSADFINYYWKKSTYETALGRAGLRVRWVPILPSLPGVKEMGEEFWQDFIEGPFMVVLDCDLLPVTSGT